VIPKDLLKFRQSSPGIQSSQVNPDIGVDLFAGIFHGFINIKVRHSVSVSNQVSLVSVEASLVELTIIMPVSLHPEQAEMLERLFPILQRLYNETEGFLDHPENQQHWYNRGYANGMVAAMTELGFADWLDERMQVDAVDIIAGHEALAWGQAYNHGVEMGHKETFEVIGPHESANDD
jgi:hypothetical protein